MKVFLLSFVVMVASFLIPLSEASAKSNPSRSPAVEPEITCVSLKNLSTEFISGKNCTLANGETVDSVLLPTKMSYKVGLSDSKQNQ